MSDIIEIRSQAKRNIVVTSLFAFAILAMAILMFAILPASYYLVGVFLTSASIVGFLIAWVKFREPKFSFLLSKNAICYQHKNGCWELSWSNVQRVDVPTVTSGIERKQLDMVAIKIKDYSQLLENMSPRLMSNILMEQRPLLFHNLTSSESSSCSKGNCYSDELLEDDFFRDENGKEYKGIKAMFANRMTKLRQRLGYDLYISGSELDRPEQRFVDLLKQCQQQVLKQSNR